MNDVLLSLLLVLRPAEVDGFRVMESYLLVDLLDLLEDWGAMLMISRAVLLPKSIGLLCEYDIPNCYILNE